MPPIERIEPNEEEEHPIPQKESRQHEWEIICGLYKNKFINYNEFEMLRHRDRDQFHDWNTNFVDEDTSIRAIHFISQKRKSMTSLTNQQPKSYSIESLGKKQRKAYDVIHDHYRSRVDPLQMIIQGFAST